MIYHTQLCGDYHVCEIWLVSMQGYTISKGIQWDGRGRGTWYHIVVEMIGTLVRNWCGEHTHTEREGEGGKKREGGREMIGEVVVVGIRVWVYLTMYGCRSIK